MNTFDELLVKVRNARASLDLAEATVENAKAAGMKALDAWIAADAELKRYVDERLKAAA